VRDLHRGLGLLGLKVGQVMEAAIPISILAIGLARVYSRRSSLLENVIITGVGGVSAPSSRARSSRCPRSTSSSSTRTRGRRSSSAWRAAASACCSSFPLRRYFVLDMHGKFPYPEATAITEVLITGEKGGSQAKLLLEATGIAAVYDFFVTTFQVWKETVDFQFIPVMRDLADKARVVLRFDAIGFILGLGYVMGLRASTLLCAGGVLANFVLVPSSGRSASTCLRRSIPRPMPICGDERRFDLPVVRPLHRRRRHRHGGHLRHPQVAPDRDRLLLDRREGVQARRGRGPRAHRTATWRSRRSSSASS
jgi:hypothetical protein